MNKDESSHCQPCGRNTSELSAVSEVSFIDIPHPNWIEIDLDNLQSNIRFVRSLIPKETKLLLPVKADAYGHGSLAISFAALEAGVDFLGVAHLFEGIALRKNGIKARILILGPCSESDFPFLIEYDLTPSIPDLETAELLSLYLSDLQCKNPIKTHIQIDTGMHRFGIDPADFEQIEKIFDLPYLEIEGMYSHFATADMPNNSQMHPAMQKQLSIFDELVKKLEAVGKRPKICHIANSPATLLFANETRGGGVDSGAFPPSALRAEETGGGKSHAVKARLSEEGVDSSNGGIVYDMVRPGIALYGYDPLGKCPSQFNIKPVLRLRSTVRALRKIAKGEGVSYGHFFIAEKNITVATVAIGYGDGYFRGEPNSGVIFIQNKPCKILGRVCMDACMVDVSDIPSVKVGDIAECINGEFSPLISMESFAAEHRTISYEITTRMARRLYRIYRYKNKMLRWDELQILFGLSNL
ncbi:hypothetical protein AGMMS49938_15320 [Fibrobacterales bacterium]|nr:hypothetical protein AGMMS49938_15320 [Fibrobacterales bacterium]